MVIHAARLNPKVIKQQFNVASNGREYALKLPRIMHEYVLLWQRRPPVMAARPQGPTRSV